MPFLDYNQAGITEFKDRALPLPGSLGSHSKRLSSSPTPRFGTLWGIARSSVNFFNRAKAESASLVFSSYYLLIPPLHLATSLKDQSPNEVEKTFLGMESTTRPRWIRAMPCFMRSRGCLAHTMSEFASIHTTVREYNDFGVSRPLEL